MSEGGGRREGGGGGRKEGEGRGKEGEKRGEGGRKGEIRKRKWARVNSIYNFMSST